MKNIPIIALLFVLVCFQSCKTDEQQVLVPTATQCSSYTYLADGMDYVGGYDDEYEAKLYRLLFGDIQVEEGHAYATIFEAASYGDVAAVKLFVEKGADVNAVSPDNEEDNLLCVASLSGNVELIKYLIALGANLRYVSPSGGTALHFAAWSGSGEVVRLLVKNGMDVNAVWDVNSGLTPLCCAAESGSLEVVKYLCKEGAAVLFEHGEVERSPVYHAAFEGNLEIFTYLASKMPVSFE